jgi:hypothetical protein
MRAVVAGHEAEVARLDPMIVRTRHSLAEAHADLENLTRRRRFRRPDQLAIDQTHQSIAGQYGYLRNLEAERARAAGQLQRARRHLDDAERAVARIPDIDEAIARRRAWFLTHPAELAWEADLATRLLGHIDEPAVPAEHDQDGYGPDHAQPELEAALRSIDLRTVNHGDRRPRTLLERAVRDALGIARHPGRPDVSPMPGRGIDGPDLGP